MNQNEEVTKDYIQFVRGRSRVRYPTEEITCYEGCGNYVIVYLTDGSKGCLRITLKQLESTYGDDVVFLQRSILAFKRQLLHVYRNADGSYEATLRNAHCIPVGRSKFKEVRALFPYDSVATRSK